MSDASFSISCIDDLGETQSCIACDCKCMRRNFFENVDFSIGEERAVGTEYSQSSLGGDKRRGEDRKILVGMGGKALSLGINSM